jgi:hypothetical protein
LDEIAIDRTTSRPRPTAHRLAEVREIAGRPSWITEGIYLGWTEDVWRQADIIILIDQPSSIAAIRNIAKRFARHGLMGARRRPRLSLARVRDYIRHSRDLASAIVETVRYYHNDHGAVPVGSPDDVLPTRAQLSVQAAVYRDKVIHVRSQSAASDLFSALGPPRRRC